HRDEHHDADANKRLGHQHRRGATTRPRCRHYRLDCVFGLFAALSGFVPDTPFADLLAKEERGEFPAALDTVRHDASRDIFGSNQAMSYLAGSTKTAVP